MKIIKNNFKINNKTSYNLVNEYLENPEKLNNINLYYVDSHKRHGSRSRGKREKRINYPAKSVIKPPNSILKKKHFIGANSSTAK